jgi:uncharacterized protein
VPAPGREALELTQARVLLFSRRNDSGGSVTFSSTDFGYILDLEPGDELVRCLIQFARDQEVESAVLVGTGSAAEVELGTSAGHETAPQRRVLREPLEASSLNGTVTLLDGEPFPCVHGTFARVDATVVGGRVFQAVCGGGFQLVVRLVSGPPVTRPALQRRDA